MTPIRVDPLGPQSARLEAALHDRLNSPPSAAVGILARLGQLQHLVITDQPSKKRIVVRVEDFRARVRGSNSVHDQLPEAKVG